MAIKAKEVGTIKRLNQTIKKRGGGDSFITYVKDSIDVRFNQEPTKWVEYYEHYDESTKKFVLDVDTDCPYCEDGLKPTQRYLVNAIDVGEQKQIALKLPSSLVEMLKGYYERFHTIMDRDYTLSREGSGKEGTSYLAAPDSPEKRNVSRYTPFDLMDVLNSQEGVPDTNGDPLLEDDDDLPPSRPVKKLATRPKPVRRAVVEDDDEPARPARRVPPRKTITKVTPAKKIIKRRP